ncbi:hypothetical protein [Aquamicrobium terrae]|uniref:DUF4142 domain-containing protein n=1 Tax=Aquamicrobium terrae TaxID=1324945 RepID=A0ABV2MW54_9HYPH
MKIEPSANVISGAPRHVAVATLACAAALLTSLGAVHASYFNPTAVANYHTWSGKFAISQSNEGLSRYTEQSLEMANAGEANGEKVTSSASTKWVATDFDAGTRKETVKLLSAFNPRSPHADISVPLNVLMHSNDAELRSMAASLLSQHIGFLRSQVQSGRKISRELKRYRQRDQRRPAWDRTPRSPLEF